MEKGSIFSETQHELVLLILYVSYSWNVPRNRKGKKKKEMMTMEDTDNVWFYLQINFNIHYKERI